MQLSIYLLRNKLNSGKCVCNYELDIYLVESMETLELYNADNEKRNALCFSSFLQLFSIIVVMHKLKGGLKVNLHLKWSSILHNID